MAVKIFEFDDNNEMILNKEIIHTYPEFHAVVLKDKGSPGDVDGRKKLHAKKVFKFIWMMYSFGSPYENLGSKIRREKSLKASGLTEKEATSTEALAAAHQFMELEDMSSITLSLLRSVRKGYFALEDHFNKIDFTQKDNKGELVNDPDRFLNSVSKLSKADDQIKALEEKVKREFKESEGIRGKSQKGYNED